MGAGKSTLLQKLRPNKLGFNCTDLDHALALDFGIHPDRLGDWISKNGFPLFRERESLKMNELLSLPGAQVIALGGGALGESFFTEIKERSHCKVVFLNTPFEVCLERIKSDLNRPMAQQSVAELKKLYDLRLSDYQKADLVLSEEDIKEIDGLDSLVHNLQERIQQKNSQKS